jgi:2,4-dienoyl-CoA reductase-like NADH-dependent reductase (Old Yellow Enzyme family)
MATARSSTSQSKRKLHTNAEQILRAGQADAILMARQFLRDIQPRQL